MKYVIFNRHILLPEVNIMNTQQLKCFLSVAENLNYAKAAQELYLTQPTVTHQIKSLENELGVRLFSRTKHSVSLTQEGILFYEDARAIIVREQIALSKLKFQGPLTDPVLSFGFSTTVEMEAFIPVLSGMAREQTFHPYLRILPRKSLWNLFMTTDLDCILSYKGSYLDLSKISVIEISDVKMVCLLPASHPLAEQSLISVSDLAESHFIFCNPAVLPSPAASLENELLGQIPPDQVYNCETAEAASALVSGGFGIAVLPENLCGNLENTVRVPFDSEVSLTCCLFFKKDISDTKRKILNSIKEQLLS